MAQQFRPEEAESILQEAVRRSLEQQPDLTAEKAISRERLEMMAAELGIEAATLNTILNERAKAQQAQVQTENTAQLRALFVSKRRTEFFEHLIPYLIINGMLVWLDMRGDGRLSWAIFPVLGWGIGLALHALETLPSRGGAFEEAFEKWRKKREKKAKKEAAEADGL